MNRSEPLIFELSRSGRTAFSLSPCEFDGYEPDKLLPVSMLREEAPDLPEVSEVDVVRHFVGLSTNNYSVDTGFYPLGSCTMKYNPKVNEEIAAMNTFRRLHPLQPDETVQGALEVILHLEKLLAEITGMDSFTLQPAAGAHGEATGLMLMKAYHEHRGDFNRKKILVPDSAHGTNPATASMIGFEVVEIPSGPNGTVDLESLSARLGDDVAGMMLTNPNTLGLFERDILEISGLVHSAGGLMYCDGANMNAILGTSRPGDMGFDLLHLNLHKTFSTPHGGGGPGSGPVGVKEALAQYLPVPFVHQDGNKYVLSTDRPMTIGKVKGFYGHFAIALRAYAYILSMGPEGLREVSKQAVLNANYLCHRLKEYYRLPMDAPCKHEFVLGGLKDNPNGITTLDIAKRLIDYGYHPPTIYFPLTVHEAMMIEPTETESLETLDQFIETMRLIAEEAIHDPELLRTAPHNSPVRRIDEVGAARNPVLRWHKPNA